MNPALIEARKELDRFTEWFKTLHPELYSKYGRNIKLPSSPGAAVGISTDFKISQEEHDMLMGVAKQYYDRDEQK
jgi:hypothetical protein